MALASRLRSDYNLGSTSFALRMTAVRFHRPLKVFSAADSAGAG
jgi:hypothetical protein